MWRGGKLGPGISAIMLSSQWRRSRVGNVVTSRANSDPTALTWSLAFFMRANLLSALSMLAHHSCSALIAGHLNSHPTWDYILLQTDLPATTNCIQWWTTRETNPINRHIHVQYMWRHTLVKHTVKINLGVPSGIKSFEISTDFMVKGQMKCLQTVWCSSKLVINVLKAFLWSWQCWGEQNNLS